MDDEETIPKFKKISKKNRELVKRIETNYITDIKHAKSVASIKNAESKYISQIKHIYSSL